ncbi:Aldo/keto reductase [Dendrothele bispora CBS 962.96]|uniref:Aldo/keto reductase n=1 Tax=Dendrothele bispora (strain CBS 962.96) TaxID=1314807 RepID=A0A4S8LQZ0_DENBC|nr:Aldo/keto reductase [Dendrothele bispora CBS 962.96]
MASNNLEQKSALKVVLGAMTFGFEGKPGIRVHNLKQLEQIIDVFRAHGHAEVDRELFDNSRYYGDGTSEEIMGQIDWRTKGLIISTKLPAFHPQNGHSGQQRGSRVDRPVQEITHNYDDMKKHMLISLKALNTDCLDLWYLHNPDRTVPYEVTMKAVNDLYKEGYFKRFGISNFMAWEVAEMVGICKANGYIMPTVYQGIYNAIHRAAEPELIPCLRKFGISSYTFNPLGGGFFTGRYGTRENEVEADAGSRFDQNTGQGRNYRDRYWNDAYFAALASIRAVTDKHSLTLTEIALRWISHHSALKREYGDTIIIGASSVHHMEENMSDLDKDPLPDEVVEAVDAAWEMARPFATKYHH